LLRLNKTPVISTEESAMLDRRAVEINRIPPLALMEEAAQAMVDRLHALMPGFGDLGITVLAGSGNNGGDALAMARRLLLAGYPVTVYHFPKRKGSDLYRQQMEILRTFGIAPLDMADFDGSGPGHGIILDGIFGIGFSYREDRDLAALFSRINDSDATIVSIDIPSGMARNAPAGVRADVTLSIGFLKDIFYEPGSRPQCGAIYNLPISFDLANIDPAVPAWLIELPLESIPRGRGLIDRFVHKYGRGAVLAVGGDAGMGGAVEMAGLSALRSGCGYVAIVSSGDGTKNVHAPELVVLSPERAMERLGKFKCAIIGPGMENPSRETRALIDAIAGSGMPVILDASFFTTYEPDYLDGFAHPPLLTPHGAEFKRFFGKDASRQNTGLVATVRDLATRHRCRIMLKNSSIITSGADGEVAIIDHPSRNAAQAGSGDIISGILAGLLAQGVTQELVVPAALDIFYTSTDHYSMQGLAGYPAADLIDRLALRARQITEAADVSQKK
jgi:hydroxyethylthiazole kinase-like uncharacterized protein yjeF